MFKKPTFRLENPEIEGESRTKNHEIIVREWLCAVLISRKLTAGEGALWGYLVNLSRGLRYEITKKSSEIAADTGMTERHFRRTLRALEEKRLVVTAKRRSKSGVRNVYYLSLTYPEEFSTKKFRFSPANFPKLWEKFLAMSGDAVDADTASPHLLRLMQGVTDIVRPPLPDTVCPVGGDTVCPGGGALSPINTNHDASPSSFYMFFSISVQEKLRQRIKSKAALQKIEEGIEKLCVDYTQEIVWERISLLYADKGESVLKPNFHNYLAENLRFYETESLTKYKQERMREIEKLASQLFLPIHEGLTQALKEKRLERPIFNASTEIVIRILKIDLQREFELLCRHDGRPSVMRGIENLFINKFIAHYNKHS
jgi:DNA-binding transcriptional ArsR family regulator